MTVPTRLIGRAQIVNRSRNRPRVTTTDQCKELTCAGQLRSCIPLCAGTDMTIDASDLRMRRHLKGDEFRVHDAMTGLAAERYRLGVMICLVAAKRADGHK